MPNAVPLKRSKETHTNQNGQEKLNEQWKITNDYNLTISSHLDSLHDNANVAKTTDHCSSNQDENKKEGNDKYKCVSHDEDVSMLQKLIQIHQQQMNIMQVDALKESDNEDDLDHIERQTNEIMNQYKIQTNHVKSDSSDEDSCNHPSSFTFDLMLHSNQQFINELSSQLFQNHLQILLQYYESYNDDNDTNKPNFLKQKSQVDNIKIMTHNLSLILLSCGKPFQSLYLLVTLFHYWIEPNDEIVGNSVTSTTDAALDFDDFEDNTTKSGDSNHVQGIGSSNNSNCGNGTTGPSQNQMKKGSPCEYSLFNCIDCRIAFLILDGIASLYKGDIKGIANPLFPAPLFSPNKKNKSSEDQGTSTNSIELLTVNNIFQWIETHIEKHTSDDKSQNNNQSEEYIHEIKFRLHLYKSRILFLPQSESYFSKHKNDPNHKMRQCKKEMKSAMEIFQHKLRLGPSSHNIKEKNNVSDTNSTSNTSLILEDTQTSSSDHQQFTQGPFNLDVQNQHALYLKANLEYLKNNHKKSLILCNEARLAGDRYRDQITSKLHKKNHGDKSSNADFNDSHYEKKNTERVIEEKESVISSPKNLDSAIHFSNLGCVLQSTGRLHMALHYYKKALNLLDTFVSASFNNAKHVHHSNIHKHIFITPDGMARRIPFCDVLHNTAICALQLKNWRMSYECMGKCVTNSPNVFAKRARCWLRMAESCIGMYEHLKNKGGCEYNIKLIESYFGIPPRLIVNQKKPQSFLHRKSIKLSQNIASKEDLLQVVENPLPRALSCLRIALTLSMNEENKDLDCIEATRLSIAYIMLELGDPVESIEMAKLIYESDQKTTTDGAEDKNDNDNNIINVALSLQRKATARLYACEAFCKIGNPKEAIIALSGQQLPTFNEDSDMISNFKKGSTKSFTMLNELAYNLAHMKSSTNSDGILVPEGYALEEKTDIPKLSEAISTLHVSLSALMASMDDIETAEKYATIAWKSLSFTEVNTSDLIRTEKSVKKALLYCYLYKGDTDNAIQLLYSMR